jgi:hypothetical protein
MVKVKNALLREGKAGTSFVSLELTGDIELVQSQNTGRFYATSKRCFISSTFDLETAQSFIGKTMPGKIVRVICDPYEFKVPESGETLLLGYTYQYQPDDMPEQLFIPQATTVGLYETIAD